MSDLVIVGRIRRSHGVLGVVVVETMTAGAEEVFRPGRVLVAGTVKGEPTVPERPLHIEMAEPFKGGFRVQFRATEYAFLLAVPAVFSSGLYKLTDIGGADAPAWGPTILGTVVAFLVGYAVIAWLMRYISTHSYLPFVIYRIALGVLLFVLVGFGVLAPDAGPAP